MSASVSSPTAAAAGAAPAPSPNPSGQSQNGARHGATPSTSTSASPSTTPGPQPLSATHGNGLIGRPINGLTTSLTSTPNITKLPSAQIVSDIPAIGPSINPSHVHNKINTNRIPGASHSPALPSTPGTPNHVLPSRSGPNPQRWTHATPQSQMISSSPAGTASRISAGFPSPKSEAMQINPKFLDDCNKLKFSIQQSLPEAVRRSVRDNWEACLLGSPFHQAFIVSLSLPLHTTLILLVSVNVLLSLTPVFIMLPQLPFDVVCTTLAKPSFPAPKQQSSSR